ncbi:kinase C delta type isoform X3 [Pelobates cultripes]|uniref:Kinase C delta type isoform X3 n=1 Tax=Pelobates cultripes TaxID=61616 RepID=A0AAD1T6D0_PELCU|nr:kinase C delta type isoform X3 [Pelobates cultripes]
MMLVFLLLMLSLQNSSSSNVIATGGTVTSKNSLTPRLASSWHHVCESRPGSDRTNEPSGSAAISLDSITFHQELGRGAFGKVMLATDDNTRQRLAVKIVKKRVLLNKLEEITLVERRVLEVASGCPFLTEAYGTFQTQDHLFFLMPYVNGGDLEEFMNKNERLDIETARDLKPENVLLDSTGHLKIADFGLALENVLGNKTCTGYAGTLGYIAPEMLDGKRYNAAVDWWALGVILYQMVTGADPFDTGHSTTTLINSTLQNTPSYPWYLTPDTKDLLEKLLSKRPCQHKFRGEDYGKHYIIAGFPSNNSISKNDKKRKRDEIAYADTRDSLQLREPVSLVSSRLPTRPPTNPMGKASKGKLSPDDSEQPYLVDPRPRILWINVVCSLEINTMFPLIHVGFFKQNIFDILGRLKIPMEFQNRLSGGAQGLQENNQDDESSGGLISGSGENTERESGGDMLDGKRYNAAVDWWALGVILYQMWIAAPPFMHVQKCFGYVAIMECQSSPRACHLSSFMHNIKVVTVSKLNPKTSSSLKVVPPEGPAALQPAPNAHLQVAPSPHRMIRGTGHPWGASLKSTLKNHVLETELEGFLQWLLELTVSANPMGKECSFKQDVCLASHPVSQCPYVSQLSQCPLVVVLNDHLFFLMPYVNGGDLEEFMNKNERLDIETARFFAAELVCGLQYLHKNGIIHRDLKPENVLLDSTGHLKIADFGLALENVLGNKTCTGYAGTLGYIAPEMLDGKRYNAAVDWWALGVILYQMLLSKRPCQHKFRGEDYGKTSLQDFPVTIHDRGRGTISKNDKKRKRDEIAYADTRDSLQLREQGRLSQSYGESLKREYLACSVHPRVDVFRNQHINIDIDVRRSCHVSRLGMKEMVWVLLMCEAVAVCDCSKSDGLDRATVLLERKGDCPFGATASDISVGSKFINLRDGLGEMLAVCDCSKSDATVRKGATASEKQIHQSAILSIVCRHRNQDPRCQVRPVPPELRTTFSG